MKFPYLLLILLCFSTFTQAQVPPTAVAPEDPAFNARYAQRSIPRVTGKLLNIPAEELVHLALNYALVTPFSNSQRSKTTTAQPDGSFRLELDYALPYQQIWFSVGDYFYAGLYADKDLYLELDMKKIKAAKEVNFNGEGVRYLGTDGPLNIYLNNYVLYERQQQQDLKSKISALMRTKAPADSVLPIYNSLSDSLKIIEDRYVAAHPSPYRWILENERISDYYADLCLKYWGKKMEDSLWQKMIQHKSYLISNSGTAYYNYMAIYLGALPGSGMVTTTWRDVAAQTDLSAYEKTLIDSISESEKMKLAYPYTLENIKKWYAQLQSRMQRIGTMRLLDNNIRQTDSLFPPAKADFMKLRMNSKTDLNEQKLALETILQSMHTPWCGAVIKGEYQRTVDKINEVNKILSSSAHGRQDPHFGQPLMETAFGASLYNVSGMKAADLLSKLKQRFPNKALLIDLWATWCGPCLGEMPHSRELHDATTDLPVVFVYLCTVSGSDESKWKSKVMELKQPGLHLLIDEKLDAELASYFSFSGYPGHAFIDKAGVYRPGAFRWMTDIPDREALKALIDR